MSEIFRGRIKEIVRGSDLSTLSSKKIREQLETEFKTDLSKRKKEIDDIVMGILVSELKNDKSQNASDDDDSEDDVSDPEPPEKKKKKSHHKDKSSKKNESDKTPTKTKKSKSNNTSDSDPETTNNDEEIARKLQDEGRSKRRRSQVKTPKKKEPKKGSKSPKATGYHKEMVLSAKLAAVLGADRMSRQDVIKKMWQVIKERNLGDPKNKQYHICDDELFAVFGTRRVKTFGMMKYLKTHVKDPELLVDS